MPDIEDTGCRRRSLPLSVSRASGEHRHVDIGLGVHVIGRRRVGCHYSGDPDVLRLWNAKYRHGGGVGTRRLVFSFYFCKLFKIHSY